MDLPTPAEIEALVAEAYADAEALAGSPGYAEASVIADMVAALLPAWDASLRPVLAPLTALALDADGDGTVTDAEAERVGEAALAVVALVSGAFAARTLAPFLALVSEGYAAASREVVPANVRRDLDDPAGLRLGFGLGGPDVRTDVWLQRHEAYWVTDYGRRVVEPRIARVVGAESLDRAELFRGGDGERARRLAAALGAEYDRGLNYWRLVATSAATRSGSLGRVAGLEAAGLDGRIDATRDRRTTEVCQYLDGKRVALADLVAWRDRVLASRTPEAVKAADRWWRDDEVPQIRALLAANGGAVPAALGPPGYHGFCRSIIVADV